MAEAFYPNSFQINGGIASLNLKFIKFAFRQYQSYDITLSSPIISYCPIWITENVSYINAPSDIFIIGLNSYDKSYAKKEYPITSNWRGRRFGMNQTEGLLIKLINGALRLECTSGVSSDFSYFRLIAVFTE